MAKTYIANVVAFLFIIAQLFGLDIPYTTEQVELALIIVVSLAAQLFTAARQLWTGRATFLGAKGPTAH